MVFVNLLLLFTVIAGKVIICGSMKEKIDSLHFKKYTDINYDDSSWLFRKRVYGATSL